MNTPELEPTGGAENGRDDSAFSVQTVAQQRSYTVSEQPGMVIGRYKLLEKVGEGGFGSVWAAEQREPIKRRVALKIIKLGMDTRQVVARFEAERQALALMDHPNIAKVFDAGATDSGRPYFVMELVRGIPITAYCDENRLSPHERLDLFTKVCHAIQHAHQKGIIHRDIKPSNILVTLHDGVPVPKVIDFGIAKATQGELTDKTIYTELAQFIGTPAYMSPEQAEMSGLDIDTRTDIYSLGVLLYELLVGATPFDAKQLKEAGIEGMRKLIREQEPPRPSSKLSTLAGDELTTTAKRRATDPPKLISLLRGDLDWIVMKCLEKDRTRRYETANGLAMDIQRHLSNEAILARPPSAAYRLRKSFQRNRMAFTAAAIVAAALITGITISTWQAISAGRARNAEREQRVAAQTERNNAQKAQKAAELARAAEAHERLTAQRLLYAANMNLVQRAWEENNIGSVQRLLAETADYPDRGFEWYFWQRQLHLDIKTLHGHTDATRFVAFSPDGQRIVTASQDKTAKIWDVATGKELRTVGGHGEAIHTAMFFPDGRRMVTASVDAVNVWDIASGRQLLNLGGHKARILSVALSPNGRRIITASEDRTAKVWEVEGGKEEFTLEGHGGMVVMALFSPDGKRILTDSIDLKARLWDAAGGKLLLALPAHHKGSLESNAFTPDSQRVVTVGPDGAARVWDVASGKELLRLQGRSGPSLSVAYSPDGLRIVTCSREQTSLWDAASGKEMLTLPGRTGRISIFLELQRTVSVVFSPDGKSLVTRADDQAVKVWDIESGKEVLSLKGHTGEILAVAFSPESQWLLTGSQDATAKLWDVSTSRKLLAIEGLGSAIRPASSRDGQRIVTRVSSETAKVWDTVTGDELRALRWPGVTIRSLAFAPDGQRILARSLDGSAKVWDADSGKELLHLKQNNGPIVSLTFSPDGACILTKDEDRSLKVWEVSSGKELFTLPALGDVSMSATFSHDGQRIATVGLNGTIAIREVAAGKELGTLATDDHMVQWPLFSPDGQRVVAVNSEGIGQVWEIASGKALRRVTGHTASIDVFFPAQERIVTFSLNGTAQVWNVSNNDEPITLQGHSSRILSTAVSPDVRMVVTGSLDQTARLWDLATGKELHTFRGHGSRVHSVAFTTDGKRIVTGGFDGAKVWDVSSGKELLMLKGGPRPDSVLRAQGVQAIGSVGFYGDTQRVVAHNYDGTATIWETATPQQVAIWQHKRDAADKRLASAPREQPAAEERALASRPDEARRAQAIRAHDPGAIKQWLVLGPLAMEDTSGAVELNREHVAGEADFAPRAGTPVKVGETERVWNAVRLEHDQIDFDEIFGERIEYGVAYAVCYIHSQNDQRGLLMKIGSNDQAKVYLNRREIYQNTYTRAYTEDQDVVSGVELKAGLNVLVFKVINEMTYWHGSVRLTDAAGKPVPGITVTLDPDVELTSASVTR